MYPSHRRFMEARGAVVNAVDRTRKAFTVEEIAESCGVADFVVGFMLRKLDLRGYVTCLARSPVVYAKSESWSVRQNDIFNASPKRKTWYDVWDFVPGTWTACGL